MLFLVGVACAVGLIVGGFVFFGGGSASETAGVGASDAPVTAPTDERQRNPQGITTTTIPGVDNRTPEQRAIDQEMFQNVVEQMAEHEGISVEQAAQDLHDQGIYGQWFQDVRDDPALGDFMTERVDGVVRPIVAVVVGRELSIPFPDGFDEEYISARFSKADFREILVPLSEALSGEDERLGAAQYDAFADQLVVSLLPDQTIAPEDRPVVARSVRDVLERFLPDQSADELGELEVTFAESGGVMVQGDG
ncbi:MAG: hypothetical protein AAGA65_16190 [Actinomycetota bacterium]